MAEFEHNGVKITLDDAGNFSARDPLGALIRKKSLSAVKAHLDKQAADDFKPFTMLTTVSVLGATNVPGTDLYRVEVVGVVRASGHGSRRDNRKEFRIKSKGGVDTVSFYATMFSDSPEAIEAYKAKEAYRKETRRIDEQREKQQDKLDAVADKFALDPSKPDFKVVRSEIRI
jgi:predicted metal-binding protein